MTGPNNLIDKNPENEENQFKNLLHDESKVTNPSCRLIFDLIGDLSSEFRTGLWRYPDDNLQYSLKKSSISRVYQVMNESNAVDFLLRLKSLSVFGGQPGRGLGVLCCALIVYLVSQAFALFLQTSN